MGQAILFGAIASSALVLGALVGGRLKLPKRVLAAMLSFAAGALITALTFEMFENKAALKLSSWAHGLFAPCC